MKKTKTKRCQVYYLPTGKTTAFRLCIWPGREKITLHKVKFKGDTEEYSERWQGKREYHKALASRAVTSEDK